jgi:hypothetical protein
MGRANPSKKRPVTAERFSYLDLIDLAMRSSSSKNSAASSCFGLGGGLRKGITSDIGPSLDASPRSISFSPAIAAFLRQQFCLRFRIRHNCFQFRSCPTQSA